MNYINVGKIVNTHGIKGELRILSDFPYKDQVFVVGNNIIIDNKTYTIQSYRVHKNFDMVTLNDYHNINDVLFLLKKDVYVDYDSLNLDDNEYLDEELMEYKVITEDGSVGKVLEIFMASQTNKIIRVLLDKEYLIPMNSPMIIGINKDKREIYIRLMKGI
jgi:16S rRNA processing protein RimM